MNAATDDLIRVPLFAGMSDRALAAVAELASEIRFADGDAITCEGDEGDAFYLVLEGVVRVDRAGTMVAEQGAGSFFGEISLIDGRPRTASITAVGPVRALVIRRQEFGELMERFGAVRLGVLMALTDRVRADEQLPTG